MALALIVLFWAGAPAELLDTHAPHHHITQLNAMKGLVGNPLELFLVSLIGARHSTH